MKLNFKSRIIAQKIVLVSYKKEHVLKYHDWMQSEELLELTASERLTLEEEYEMQNSWFADEDKCTFIILDKDSFDSTGNEVASMIGDVNLYLNNSEDRNAAEIEIMIADHAHRGKGKGREALLCMLRYGVDTLELRKFTAKIKIKNFKSRELFKSIGFIQTGKSEYFQEVELTCDVTEEWIKQLYNKTQMYNKKEL